MLPRFSDAKLLEEKDVSILMYSCMAPGSASLKFLKPMDYEMVTAGVRNLHSSLKWEGVCCSP